MFERNRPGDTFGWGVVFSDADAGQSERRRRRRRAATITRQLRPLGRHRGPFPRPRDPLGRPRLLRHRAQAPAQHPAGARARSSASSWLRDARSSDLAAIAPTPTCSSPPTASTAACAPRYAEHFRPTIDVRAQPVHLARHAPALRRLHLHLRADRARLVLGARLPLRRRASTFIVECREETWRARGPRSASTPETSIAFCEALFAP